MSQGLLLLFLEAFLTFFFDLFWALCAGFLWEGWVFRHSSSSLRIAAVLLLQASVGDGFQENSKAERGVSLKNRFL